jgi:hypothetical protein
MSVKKPRPDTQYAAEFGEFERHKKELLDPLRRVYERSPKTKPFDANSAWRHLSFAAHVYLLAEAEVSKKQAMMPAGDRAKLLIQLGKALRDARSKADEAMKTVCSHWFVEWADANGNPDFTSPIIERFHEEFEKRVAGLAVLETAAFRAAETVRKKRGRPAGTAVLPHDIIVSLESAYRDITKRNSGAGPGPFARFVRDFLKALGRSYSEQAVIEAIKDAKKREQKHPATSKWGRDSFDDIGGKRSPVRSNSPS